MLELLVNNSLYPVTEGSVYFRYSTNSYNSLPKLIKTQGYDTFSMHAYKASFWNRSMMHPLQGFNRFYSRRDYEMDDLKGRWGLSDESFFRQNLEIFKNKKDTEEPFYSFIISLTSHYPYEAFEDQDEINTGNYEDYILGDYIEAINYLDMVLGKTLKELENMGYLDNSVIVMYGDHEGVKTVERESFLDEMNLPDNKDIFKYEMKRVPLIIHLPNGQNAGKYNRLCGMIDVMPTICNLYGIKSKYMFGMDILNQERDYIAFSTKYITNGNLLYSDKDFVWFDIESGKEIYEDPGLNSIRKRAFKEIDTSYKILEHNLLDEFMK